MNIFLLLLLFYLSLMCPVWSFCSCDHLVWFNTRNNPAFPLCEEDLGFGSKLWQLSLWSNSCCLLQHGGLRGAEGNMWNHLPEIPPVCVQLYVLGESPVRRVWVLLQRLLTYDTYDSTSEFAETWGWRLRGQAVTTAWSVSKHRWRRKKMRGNHFIFKQSKIGIIGWSLLLFWLVELQQSSTAMHLKAKSSQLSSNEDTVFWECTTTNNCHIWMRRIKLFQARNWFWVWNCTLPICDNHLSARQSDVSNWQKLLGLSSARYWRHHHVDVLLLNITDSLFFHTL